MSPGEELKPGDHHWRAFVGDPANYDLIAATTFNLMTTLGLRDHHRVLDVGCGSLRVGRLLIPYLLPEGYVGIEPNEWLVEDGIARETGRDIIDIKRARFVYSSSAAVLKDAEPFDFILLQSIFSHCGQDLVSQWLDELAPLLANDGVMLATWVPAEKSSGESGWLYPGLVRYKESEFYELVRSKGLTIRDLNWPHPIQRWSILVHANASLAWLDEYDLDFRRVFERLRKPKPGSAAGDRN